MSHIMKKVEHMSEAMMAEVSSKFQGVTTGLDAMSLKHGEALAHKLQQMETRIDSLATLLENKIAAQLSASEASNQRREASFEELASQLQAHDDSLGKSIDMLQVRYESVQAEVSRLQGMVETARQETERQLVGTVTTCGEMNSKLSAEFDAVQSSMGRTKSDIEQQLAVNLSKELQQAADNESTRFQSLCKSVDERLLLCTQQVCALCVRLSIQLCNKYQ